MNSYTFLDSLGLSLWIIKLFLWVSKMFKKRRNVPNAVIISTDTLQKKSKIFPQITIFLEFSRKNSKDLFEMYTFELNSKILIQSVIVCVFNDKTDWLMMRHWNVLEICFDDFMWFIYQVTTFEWVVALVLYNQKQHLDISEVWKLWFTVLIQSFNVLLLLLWQGKGWLITSTKTIQDSSSAIGFMT